VAKQYSVANASLSWDWVRLFTGAAVLCSHSGRGCREVGGLKAFEWFASG